MCVYKRYFRNVERNQSVVLIILFIIYINFRLFKIFLLFKKTYYFKELIEATIYFHYSVSIRCILQINIAKIF